MHFIPFWSLKQHPEFGLESDASYLTLLIVQRVKFTDQNTLLCMKTTSYFEGNLGATVKFSRCDP